MKREIKFRGKRLGNEEWVYGYYGLTVNGKHYIESVESNISMSHNIVIPETVGQFTGLTDIFGKYIFEDDVLLSKSWGANSMSKRKAHIVKWGKVGWVASGYNGEFVVNPQLDVKLDWEIIGNIHDNTDLLK